MDEMIRLEQRVVILGSPNRLLLWQGRHIQAQ